MEFTQILGVLPIILSTIREVIEILSREKGKLKKLKGTGISKKIELLEERLSQIGKIRETLLFYARFLPDTASVYTLADKMSEMIVATQKDLEDKSSARHDSSWQVITMIYGTVKLHKQNNIISKTENCPYSDDSTEIKDINEKIRELDLEFSKSDSTLINRNTAMLLDHAQRISCITSDLKGLIIKHTEQIINSISFK